MRSWIDLRVLGWEKQIPVPHATRVGTVYSRESLACRERNHRHELERRVVVIPPGIRGSGS